MNKIPSVNLLDFLSENPQYKQKFVNQLGQAYETIGFVALKGHFLDDSLMDSLYSEVKKFFDLTIEQKQNYEKYAPMVANREELERTKMFYAITEAKAIEGSAVLMGSNSFTPTISSTTKETVVEVIEEKSAIEKWLKS